MPADTGFDAFARLKVKPCRFSGSANEIRPRSGRFHGLLNISSSPYMLKVSKERAKSTEGEIALHGIGADSAPGAQSRLSRRER